MNESATVECPWCQQSLAIPAGAIGQRVSCQFCSGKFMAETPAGPGGRKFGGEPQSEPGCGDTEDSSEAVGGGAILIAGFLLLLVAAGLTYWSIYRPWDAMRRHEPGVSWTSRERNFAVYLAVFAAGVCGWGLVKLLLRRRYAARGPTLMLDDDKYGKLAMLLVGLVALGLSFKLDSWFDDQIRTLGYQKVDRTSKYAPTQPPERPVPESLTFRHFHRLPDESSKTVEGLRKSLKERVGNTGNDPGFWREQEEQLKEQPAKRP